MEIFGLYAWLLYVRMKTELIFRALQLSGLSFLVFHFCVQCILLVLSILLNRRLNIERTILTKRKYLIAS